MAAKVDWATLSTLLPSTRDSAAEHTREQLFKIIEERRKAGWTFVFLGAGRGPAVLGATRGGRASLLGKRSLNSS